MLKVAKNNYKRIVFWIHEVDKETVDPVKDKIPLIYVYSLNSLKKTAKKEDLVIISCFNLVSDSVSDDLLSFMDNNLDIDFGGFSYRTKNITDRVGLDYDLATDGMGNFVFTQKPNKVHPNPNYGIWEPDDLLNVCNIRTFKNLG